MGVLFVYILKSSVCLAAFYLFYRLLLSKDTFHVSNRIALFGILVLSMLLPLCEVSTRQESDVYQTMMTLEQILLMTGEAEAALPVSEVTSLSGVQLLLLVYLCGILCFGFHHLYSLVRLLLLLRSGRRERREPGVVLIVHSQEVAPFSWMRYIVISEKDLEENGREILIHEAAHIRYRHSIDLCVADLCIFFQWFNPGAWLLRQELQNIHEYQADECVIREGVDAKQYQLLLIEKAVGTRLYSMANSFNHSKLKKRITMMLKKKSNPWARLKYLYVLPLAAIAVTAFARPEVSDKMEEISAVKVNDLKEIVETKVLENQVRTMNDTVKKKPEEKAIFEVVENMPEYPGGMVACLKFLGDNQKYPAEALAKKIGGRVVVQFVINKDGLVVEPKVVRSVDPTLDKEALRLVMSMPKWKPGMQRGQAVRVRYSLPVSFEATNKPVSEANGIIIRSSGDVKPLILIDGKEVSTIVMDALDPSKIQSISVLKDKTAQELYGEKGKDGVILITLIPNDKSVGVNRVSDSISVIGYGRYGIKSEDAGELIKVSGHVKDESGRPVIGANVILEGTTNGTITDMNGNFIISAPKNATLALSYIGMQTTKVRVAPALTVSLKPGK